MKMERLNGGRFVIAPTDNAWESRGTSNSGAVLLLPSDRLFDVLENALGQSIREDARLADGVVVCLYSAKGVVPGDPVSRQRRGLAVLSPELELCARRTAPVLSPDTDENSVDLRGIEDARVTYTDGRFFIWYCGYNGTYGMPCCAYSDDLLSWHKQTPLPGDVGQHEDKDHVVFPEPFGGRWWMLHRPWGHEIPDANHYVIRLASAPSVYGPWTDEGELLRGLPADDKPISWVGGGAAPLKMSDGRYFVLYHNGCFFRDRYREYDACACVIDLSAYRPGDLSGMVSCRTEPLARPETECEKNDKLRIDIIFPMSAHLYRGNLYFLYGAGDRATCAARMDWAELMREMNAASQ